MGSQKNDSSGSILPHGSNSNYMFSFYRHRCLRRGFSFYMFPAFLTSILFRITLIDSFSFSAQSSASIMGFSAKERVFRLYILKFSAGTSKESVILNVFSRQLEFLRILCDFFGKQGLKRLDLKFSPAPTCPYSSSSRRPSRFMQNSCNFLCLMTVLLAFRIWVKSVGRMQTSELLLFRPLLFLLSFLLSQAILRFLLKKGRGARLLKNCRYSIALGIRSGRTEQLVIVFVMQVLLMWEMGRLWRKWGSVCLKISSRSGCPFIFRDCVRGTCILFQTAIIIANITRVKQNQANSSSPHPV